MLTPFARDNPVRRFPLVSTVLIASNIVLFVASIADIEQHRAIVSAYGLTPDHARILTFFTSMFLHGGWEHLLMNMFFLFLFGPNVEDLMGRIVFPFFYIACGLAAAGMHFLWVHGGPDAALPLIGASGAISGLLGAYFVLFPQSTIRALLVVFPVRIRAFWFILLWFITQVSSIGEGSDVAFMAHIGGFLFGAGILFILLKMGIVIVPNYDLVKKGLYSTLAKNAGYQERLERAYASGDYKQMSYTYAAMLAESPSTVFGGAMQNRLGAAMLAADRPDLAVAAYRRTMEVYPDTNEAFSAALEVARIAVHFYNDYNSAEGYLNWIARAAPMGSEFARAARNDLSAIHRARGGLF